MAALQASAEVLQLHRCVCGLPALQGFAQASLRAGSAAGKPCHRSALWDAYEMTSNVLPLCRASLKRASGLVALRAGHAIGACSGMHMR